MATLTRNINLEVDPTKSSEDRKKNVRTTKIVCTIGPKTMEVEAIKKLLDAGMNVARFNFSHGSHEFHGRLMDNVRKAVAESGKQCALMLDTKGPEIRTGKLKNKTLELKIGQKIAVGVDNNALGDEEQINLDYQNLVSSVEVGYNILIADGLISLTVIGKEPEKKRVLCVVNNNATLGETKNCHLPGAIVDLPAVSERDESDIKFGIEKDVDFIAASFIRKADDVLTIRKLLGNKASDIKIISKIENQEGLQNFAAILEASDGIMVARGDLGVELPMHKIFAVQKQMISRCNALGKPVITATQMLESMIENPRPTRAECTDIANAVLDGTDAVMLSGETAGGDYPIEAVNIMAQVCKEAEVVERKASYPHIFEALSKATEKTSIAEAVSSYAVRTAIDLNARLIVVVSETGRTALAVAKWRPRVPVVCATFSQKTSNHLLLTKAIIPCAVQREAYTSTFDIADTTIEWAKSKSLVVSGETVVIVAGHIKDVAGKTNTLRVIRAL